MLSRMTVFRHRAGGPGSAGDEWVTTLHTVGIASVSAAHEAFNAFLNAAIVPHLLDMWTPGTQITQTQTDQLDDFGWHNVAQVTTSNVFTGTSPGSAPSPSACMVVGLRSESPTRAGRGRMYLPSPSGAHYNAAGRFIVAQCENVATDFAAGLRILRDTVDPVIAHASSRTTTIVTRVTVGDIPGEQRRRVNKDSVTYSTVIL